MSRPVDFEEESAVERRAAYEMLVGGESLAESGRVSEAIRTYDQIAVRFGSRSDLVLSEIVASALLNKSAALRGSQCYGDAIAVDNEIVSRYGPSHAPELLRMVGLALLDKGECLRRLGRFEEAIAANDELVGRFGDGQDDHSRELVALALESLAGIRRALGDRAGEIDAYDEIVVRCAWSTNEEVLAVTAKAMFNKSVALGEMRRGRDQARIREEILRRFGESANPAVAAVVKAVRESPR